MNNFRLFKNIEKHIPLSNSDKNHLNSCATTKIVGKKELVLRQGQLCKELFFVESGSLRAFNCNKDGKESTIMFAVQDWWVTDMHCFTNQLPALLSIETLEDCKLIAFNFHALEELFKSVSGFERFFRIRFQNAYIREQLRVLDTISLTTEERYEKFMKKYPKIAEKVSQKQIASYLGVTPEFLSSVKKK